MQLEMIPDRLQDHVVDAAALLHSEDLQFRQQVAIEPQQCGGLRVVSFGLRLGQLLGDLDQGIDRGGDGGAETLIVDHAALPADVCRASASTWSTPSRIRSLTFTRLRTARIFSSSSLFGSIRTEVATRRSVNRAGAGSGCAAGTIAASFSTASAAACCAASAASIASTSLSNSIGARVMLPCASASGPPDRADPYRSR